MQHAKLISNALIITGCFIIAFLVVLFPLGPVVYYLTHLINDVLNSTGVGFADGDADPAFLWVVLLLTLALAGALIMMVRNMRFRG
ncbi:hypothetical protein RJ498_000347 [Pluralibacter gergoviae]